MDGSFYTLPGNGSKLNLIVSELFPRPSLSLQQDGLVFLAVAKMSFIVTCFPSLWTPADVNI